MTTLAFLTDIHANLPALEVILEKIKELSVDEIIIGGDSIGIGPYPNETLARLMDLSKTTFINGNHELVAIHGVSKLVEELGPNHGGYLEHAQWCNSQLSPEMLEYLKKQPLIIKKNVEDVTCIFMHYAINYSRSKSVYPYKSEKLKDTKIQLLFSEFPCSLLGFGHYHFPYMQKIDTITYLNPGSIGCYEKPIARFAVIKIQKGSFEINEYALGYNETELYKEFEERNVPDRKFIYKAFFGGRFTVK